MGKGCEIQPKCRYCYIQKTMQSEVLEQESICVDPFREKKRIFLWEKRLTIY